MRVLLGIFCCLSLAAADLSQLRRLEEKDRIFELRRAVSALGGDDAEALFYRGVISARFGNEAAAIEDLRKFAAANPEPKMKRTAYEELASALVRMNRYGESAMAWSQALGLTPKRDPDRAGNDNSRRLYESLRDVAPQTISFGEAAPIQATKNEIGSLNVPVEVNGHKSDWIFDTGADTSTITESEAVKLGLTVRDTATYVNGSTGAKNPLRVAVAEDLQLGNARLTHVVFLVLSDRSLYIAPVKYQIVGILGLPVIRALGRVTVSGSGAVHIENAEPSRQGEPNLFFDDLSLIVETGHAGHLQQMHLDTGANATIIYPSFRDALGKGETEGLKSKGDTTAGAGGTMKRRIEVFPTLRLEILGKPDDMADVSLLRRQPAGNRYRDGLFGMDALNRGFTLDFRTMQLLLD